jgi:hypothetical protein
MTYKVSDKDNFDANYSIVKRHLDAMLRIVVTLPNTELYFGLEEAINNLKHEADYVQEMMKHD